jgi:hypothetical protein
LFQLPDSVIPESSDQPQMELLRLRLCRAALQWSNLLAGCEQVAGCRLQVAGCKLPQRAGVQPATFNLQLSTCNFQPATFNLQLSTCNFQPATFNLQLSTCNPQLLPDPSRLRLCLLASLR